MTMTPTTTTILSQDELDRLGDHLVDLLATDDKFTDAVFKVASYQQRLFLKMDHPELADPEVEIPGHLMDETMDRWIEWEASARIAILLRICATHTNIYL